MSQQHFQFHGQFHGQGDLRRESGRQVETREFQGRRGVGKPARLLNPGDLPHPGATLVLRVAEPHPEQALQAGELILVSRLSAECPSRHSWLAVKSTSGGIGLVRGSELTGEQLPGVIGELVMALPGARGLRYVPNLYPFSRAGINQLARVDAR